MTRQPASAKIRTIRHEASHGFTRNTFYAVVIFTDGTESPCPHTSGGHRTRDAAVVCGRAEATRYGREWLASREA